MTEKNSSIQNPPDETPRVNLERGLRPKSYAVQPREKELKRQDKGANAVQTAAGKVDKKEFAGAASQSSE